MQHQSTEPNHDDRVVTTTLSLEDAKKYNLHAMDTTVKQGTCTGKVAYGCDCGLLVCIHHWNMTRTCCMKCAKTTPIVWGRLIFRLKAWLLNHNTVDQICQL